LSCVAIAAVGTTAARDTANGSDCMTGPALGRMIQPSPSPGVSIPQLRNFGGSGIALNVTPIAPDSSPNVIRTEDAEVPEYSDSQ
jgi:hypothetical protein